ncbi:gamma-glutamylcyclotransferase [Actinokineospora soli]|uniref:Gamma-glutamylcyclotransferase n=1 Tax=Actinokineospora soli TaxID=1048753 RepID=A0ABW2TGB4_9PSEU
MFPDADFPAVPYPGARPDRSYVHDAGHGHPLSVAPDALSGWRVGAVDLDAWLAERGCAPLAERTPLLSYGSNANPSKLTWLRAAHGLSGPVVVLRARTVGLSAVWAAGLRVVDDQRPAVLAAAPGVVEDHAVVMAAEDQVVAFDKCEGRGDRYQLARVSAGVVTTEDGGSWDAVLAYVGAREIRRPLLVRGGRWRARRCPRRTRCTWSASPPRTTACPRRRWRVRPTRATSRGRCSFTARCSPVRRRGR